MKRLCQNGFTRLLVLCISFLCLYSASSRAKSESSENKEPKPQSDDLYEAIATENLTSFGGENKNESHSFDSYAEYLNWSLQKQVDLSAYEKRRSVFKLFQDYEKLYPTKPTAILDFTTIEDLNLLSGPRSDPAAYVADKVARTKTEFGRAFLYRMLVDPICDIEQLHDRQAIVQEFVSNKELFDKLNIAFDDLQTAESLLLSFWQDDAFKSAVQRKEIHLPWKFNFIEALNKNSMFLECSERLDQARELTLCACEAASTILLPAIAYFLITNNRTKAKTLTKFAQKHMGLSTLTAFFSGLGIFSWALKKSSKSKWTEGLNHTAVAANYGMLVYYAYDSLKGNAVLLKCLQKKLMAVAHYIRALSTFRDLFVSNPLLKEKLQAIKNIDLVLNDIPAQSPDFKELLENLQTDTFMGEPSLLSFAGRILATFKLMHEQKDHLSAAFMALAEVDAFMAIARLYNEQSTTTNGWCFAEFIENGQGPSVELEDFWNPFLDAEKAVANSLAFGAHGNPRTFIITGPNEGGKSTIMMKGVPLCIILAQSFGIAPAKKMRLTPFYKVITYLNITDDLAAGNSHFKAGVVRAQKLLEMANSLQDHHYGFISADEVFNGTTYREGQAAAYSLIEYLGKHPKILCTTATHFPLITSLEEKNSSLFKNYKVSIAYDKDGQLKYPFKIEPGISHQNIALDILRKEGFDHDFLSRAQDVLQAASAA